MGAGQEGGNIERVGAIRPPARARVTAADELEARPPARNKAEDCQANCSGKFHTSRIPSLPMRLDPRKLQQMVRQMKVEEVNATRVVIETTSGNIVFDKPSVTAMAVPGAGKAYQVMGNPRHEAPGAGAPAAPAEPSGEDVALVREQAGASEEEAREALRQAGGDLAAAILRLKKG